MKNLFEVIRKVGKLCHRFFEIIVIYILWIGMILYWLLVDVIFSCVYYTFYFFIRKGSLDIDKDYIDKLPK